MKNKKVSYFMCKEMLYDYVTDRLGQRKNAFINSIGDHPELESDVEKIKAAMEFALKLSDFSVEPKFIDEISNPSRVKRLWAFLKIPMWAKVVFVFVILSACVLVYLQNQIPSATVEFNAANIQPQEQLIQTQTLRFSLNPKTKDNLTGLVEKKLLELGARAAVNTPLWKKVDDGVLFVFIIDRTGFSKFGNDIQRYGEMLNLGDVEPENIDNEFYKVELLLKT